MRAGRSTPLAPCHRTSFSLCVRALNPRAPGTCFSLGAELPFRRSSQSCPAGVPPVSAQISEMSETLADHRLLLQNSGSHPLVFCSIQQLAGTGLLILFHVLEVGPRKTGSLSFLFTPSLQVVEQYLVHSWYSGYSYCANYLM